MILEGHEVTVTVTVCIYSIKRRVSKGDIDITERFISVQISEEKPLLLMNKEPKQALGVK